LVSRNNFNFIQDTSIPLSKKAQSIQVVLRVYGDLLELYTNALMKKQYYHQELIGIHLFGLGVSEKMLKLAESINESKDPEDKALQYGYQSIQGIYSSILLDLLKVQKNTEMYLPDDLELLCDSISSSVSLNKHAISDRSANEMTALMMEIVNDPLSDHVKNSYTELIGLFAATDNEQSVGKSVVRESK
jgi:hypothetical protein